MKRKIFNVLAVFVASLLVVSTALAFGLGNADGVWEYVEDNSDPATNAFCVTYGVGQGTSETARSRNNPSIQATDGNTFENQVRYGKGSSQTTSCPTTAPTSTWFDAQSGLGFDGNNTVGASVSEGTPFWLGRLTHYNNPIYLSNDGTTQPEWAFMRWIDVDVTVQGITCNNGQPPSEGSTMTFTYRVNFDETPNNASPCPYGGNNDGCYDRVQVGTAPPAASFNCPDDAVPGIYTITLLGFQPHSSTNCATQTYNSGLVNNQYITAERSTNNACLWAQISDFVPTAVEMQAFTATRDGSTVKLAWQTVSEENNLGFNLYRSETMDGAKTMLNTALVPSAVPGSSEGAGYEFVDTAPLTGVAYYWLEHLDISGSAEMLGPVEVEALSWTASPYLRLFLPVIKTGTGFLFTTPQAELEY